MEASNQSMWFPVKMGLITGFTYCLFIFLENKIFYKSPVQFTSMKLVFYLLIIGGYFYTGWIARKSMGGFITFQECLKAILLTIAIVELIYVIFNVIYINYIDPSFIAKLKVSTKDFLISINTPEEKVTEVLKNFEAAGKVTFWSAFQSYGFSLIIDSIFGVLIALLLRKSPTVTEY